MISDMATWGTKYNPIYKYINNVYNGTEWADKSP